MHYSQYLIIEKEAGGRNCTDKQFIKACHTMRSAYGKSRQTRDSRHEWIREGLHYLNQHRKGWKAWGYDYD